MTFHPEIRADVYRRIGQELPTRAKSVLESAKAEAPDEKGLLLLIGIRANDGRGFDGIIRLAVEHIAVGQRPSTEWERAHELVSKPIPGLRKRLFALTIAYGPESPNARACLTAIEIFRDENGTAEGETRHPGISADVPWPMLPQTQQRTIKLWHRRFCEMRVPHLVTKVQCKPSPFKPASRGLQ